MKLFIFLLLISAFRPQLRGQNILVSEKIIFDTDMGSDCDDAGALALLHAYATLGKAEIIGCIYSSGVVPYGAAVVEAINVYYGRPDIPVGACHGSEVGDPVDKMNAEKGCKWRIGETRYKHNFIRQKPGTDSLFAGYLNDLISRLPER
ncbi:MAG: hypothetical protein ACOZDD_02965 [Bacteroidota bacterium]